MKALMEEKHVLLSDFMFDRMFHILGTDTISEPMRARYSGGGGEFHAFLLFLLLLIKHIHLLLLVCYNY